MIGLKSALSLLVLSLAGANAQCILTAGKVNLLSAQGLATPWQLSGGCSMADPGTQTFLEATIFEPAQNKIFAYAPLIINAGTTPLVPPVVPNISPQAIIVYHLGSNANTVTLMDQTNGQTLKNANCVNGAANSVFGQFGYCNAVNFFNAARGKVQVPALGTALDGSTCPTTRNFAVVDQDQSDNVVTTYLQVGTQTAQNTAANLKKFPKATVIANPSDNALITQFIDPAIGCKPFTVPALDDPGAMRSTLAGDELQAAAHQAAPQALVPMNDPMALNNNNADINKVNLYRAGVDQPPANANGASGKQYCLNYGQIAPPVILRQGTFTSQKTTPAAAVGSTLFTFLGNRFNMSWVNLNCQALTGMPSPIIANLDGNGVAQSLTFFIGGMQFGPTTTGGKIAGVPIGKNTLSNSMPSSSAAATSSTTKNAPGNSMPSSSAAATSSTTKNGGNGNGNGASTSAPPASTSVPAAAPSSTTKKHRHGHGGNGNGAAASSAATSSVPAAAPTTSVPAAAASTTAKHGHGNGNGGGNGGAAASSTAPSTTSAAAAPASATTSAAAAAATTTSAAAAGNHGHRHRHRHGRRSSPRRIARF